MCRETRLAIPMVLDRGDPPSVISMYVIFTVDRRRLPLLAQHACVALYLVLYVGLIARNVEGCVFIGLNAVWCSQLHPPFWRGGGRCVLSINFAMPRVVVLFFAPCRRLSILNVKGLYPGGGSFASMLGCSVRGAFTYSSTLGTIYAYSDADTHSLRVLGRTIKTKPLWDVRSHPKTLFCLRCSRLL